MTTQSWLGAGDDFLSSHDDCGKKPQSEVGPLFVVPAPSFPASWGFRAVKDSPPSTAPAQLRVLPSRASCRPQSPTLFLIRKRPSQAGREELRVLWERAVGPGPPAQDSHLGPCPAWSHPVQKTHPPVPVALWEHQIHVFPVIPTTPPLGKVPEVSSPGGGAGSTVWRVFGA